MSEQVEIQPERELVPNPTPPSDPEPAAAGAPTPERRSIAHVLRNYHAFRIVWIASFGSSIGAFMEHVGVAWVINKQTEKPAVMLGYLAAAQLLPMMVLGIPGGLLADHVNRKKLLLATQACLMVIAAGVTAVSAMGLTKGAQSGPILLALMTAMGITIAFNVPAWQVLTPRLVAREDLGSAIYLNGLQFNLARIIGPALGGVLLSAVGTTALFAINTASFVGILIAISLTPDAPAPKQHETSVWKKTVAAFRFVLHDRGPRALFFAMVVFCLLALPFMRFMPLFVSQVYVETRDPAPEETQELAYGVLLALMGIGAVLAVVGTRWIPPWYPRHHFIPLSILGGGVAITLFGLSGSIIVGGLATVLAGVFWMWTFNSGFTALQLLVPDAMRGRVLAVVNVATFGAMALGPVVAGWAGELIAGSTSSIGTDEDTAGHGAAAQVVVAATGALLILAGLVMLTWRTPEVDGLKPGDNGFERRPGLLRGITAAAHRPRP